ncbi:hypothetical protein ACE1CI_08460 [Aerosakkonemataceae cyanobacterium BLCC-F50]|uniref:Uncharacterized protein n=1 Tax=Floridaenema flaviceps BLCC-F50 TaxID=3153642 RepID=A0ABV4XMM6_9CYAN
MKGKITLVISLTLSFLMMFSSIAKAEEVKIQITVTTSEPGQIEVVKAPPLREGEQVSELEECNYRSRCGECKTSNDNFGTWKTKNDGSTTCEPCLRATCGTSPCTPPGGGLGGWVWNQQKNLWECLQCPPPPNL